MHYGVRTTNITRKIGMPATILHSMTPLLLRMILLALAVAKQPQSASYGSIHTLLFGAWLHIQQNPYCLWLYYTPNDSFIYCQRCIILYVQSGLAYITTYKLLQSIPSTNTLGCLSGYSGHYINICMVILKLVRSTIAFFDKLSKYTCNGTLQWVCW